jgi:hypothetical protein
MVTGWLQWVDDQLYVAFVIGDPTTNNSIDSLRVYFDTNNNGGDPDESDRFFQIIRDGTLTTRAGTGTENDGLDWNSGYTSEEWTAMVANQGGAGWAIEMQIDAALEMPDLLAGDAFGMMVLVQYTGSLGIWPDDAITNATDSWQTVKNADCQ